MQRSIQGTCDHCSAPFAYELLHAGFSELAYAYCDRCGQTALLDGWSPKVPPEALAAWHQAISPSLEPLLAACACGGRFRADASPRCPSCGKALSAAAAADWIEANAEGTKVGWRWQRSWTGLYCIVINGRSVKDPWLPSGVPAAEP
jgi:hypothetical protein